MSRTTHTVSFVPQINLIRVIIVRVVIGGVAGTVTVAEIETRCRLSEESSGMNIKRASLFGLAMFSISLYENALLLGAMFSMSLFENALLLGVMVGAAAGPELGAAL